MILKEVFLKEEKSRSGFQPVVYQDQKMKCRNYNSLNMGIKTAQDAGLLTKDHTFLSLHCFLE